MPTITINNHPLEVEEGTSILQAARALGIEVPTLCYWEGVRPMNSCMLCVVRNTKTGQVVPSCSTIVTDGLEVETDSGDVCSARKEVLELIISEHVGDCEAPCSQGCPASMNIPIMMRQIYAGDMEDAAYTVTNGLVFPWTLGYVCPAPCQGPCRRKSYDTTMQIRELHKSVAEQSAGNNEELLECEPDTGKHIAVVGGGFAGMAAAYVLRKRGHAVTLYEKEAQAGAKLRLRSEEDLPKHVLDTEIEWILRLGVNFEYNREISGEELAGLEAENDAIVLACKGVGKAAGKIFTAADHKLDVRSVGNGKTTAQWIDRYLKSLEPDPKKGRFYSKYGKLKKPLLEKLRERNENQEAMEILTVPVEETLVDSQQEAGRCLHCDCRKLATCGLRKWASEYGAEKTKYKTDAPEDLRILGGPGNIIFEPGKCIRCGLCIEIAKMHGEDIGLTFVNRGFEMTVEVPFNHSFEEALQKSAEECIAACPTAAIAYYNKEDVVDCHTTDWIEV